MKPGKIVKKYKLGNQEIIFRYPKMSDIKDLLELINNLVKEKVYIGSQQKKTLKEEKHWLENTLTEIKNREKVHLVVEVNGKIMGNTDIKKSRMAAEQHTGTFGIMIRREIRGTGISERLFKAIEKEAKKVLKIKIIKLTAFTANKRASAFYKKQGFRTVGRIKNGLKYYGRYADEIIMVKYL